jgi:capsular polysaccharide transport system permease protein
MRAFAQGLAKHRRIMWALIMRELSTRYGRNNLGFLWLVGEPIVFAGGVSILWTFIRPPYENGIKLIPFIITGYLPLIMVRHVIGHTVGAIKNNNTLLFHRMVSPLHLLLARIVTELIGASLGAVVVIIFYNIIGVMGLPPTVMDFANVYAGWFLLAWLSSAVAIVMAALTEIFEFTERFVQVITYIIVPLSGTFIMVASMPPKYQSIALAVPFAHEFELIRHGYFGDSIATVYSIPYVIIWCSGLSIVGLWLIGFVRSRIEIDG